MLRQHLFGRTGVSIFLSTAPIRPSSIGKIWLTTILSRSNYLQIQTVFRIIHFCESIYKTLSNKKENCIQSPGVSWLRVVICILILVTKNMLQRWHMTFCTYSGTSHMTDSHEKTQTQTMEFLLHLVLLQLVSWRSLSKVWELGPTYPAPPPPSLSFAAKKIIIFCWKENHYLLLQR